jgi:hypothetical protein
MFQVELILNDGTFSYSHFINLVLCQEALFWVSSISNFESLIQVIFIVINDAFMILFISHTHDEVL